jgi:hypothetical protein
MQVALVQMVQIQFLQELLLHLAAAVEDMLAQAVLVVLVVAVQGFRHLQVGLVQLHSNIFKATPAVMACLLLIVRVVAAVAQAQQQLTVR